jgi:superfamily II RNA helicase
MVHGASNFHPRFDAGFADRQIMQTCEIVLQLFEKDMRPVVVFCFKRCECHSIAESFGSHSFTTEDHANHISDFVDLTIEKLSEEDQKLQENEVANN